MNKTYQAQINEILSSIVGSGNSCYLDAILIAGKADKEIAKLKDYKNKILTNTSVLILNLEEHEKVIKGLTEDTPTEQIWIDADKILDEGPTQTLAEHDTETIRTFLNKLFASVKFDDLSPSKQELCKAAVRRVLLLANDQLEQEGE